MNNETKARLLELNQRFYQTVANDFDQTRQSYWAGWKKILPFIEQLAQKNDQLSVLDVGCGNGRLGEFLHEHLPEVKISYVGLDTNAELLQKAESRLSGLMSVQLLQQDITEINIEEGFDLVVCFGVMHHLPGQDLRAQILHSLLNHTKPDGILIWTSWRFLNHPALKLKTLSPTILGINETELDAGDFLIGWNQQSHTYRYCHHLDLHEVRAFKDKTGLKELASFVADGQNQATNHYFVWQSA